MRWMSTRQVLTAAFVTAISCISLSAQQISSGDLLDGLANPARWLTYSGDYSGRRHSPLKEITAANAGRLAAQWTFQTGLSGHKVRGHAHRHRRRPVRQRPDEHRVGD